MKTSFSTEIERLLNSVFLDVDEYNPEEFYDPNDKFNINEVELRQRLSKSAASLDAALNSL